MILAFDTETTGLPLYLPDGTMEQPYITQLSAILYDVAEKRVIHAINSYIKLPPGVVISEKASEISGITHEICEEKGRPIGKVLKDFYKLYNQCDTLVAHNYDFDKARIVAEIRRNGFPEKMFSTVSEKKIICTMKSEKNWIMRRWPKLIDLYRRLFGYSVNADLLHNSFVDTALCLRIVLKTEFNVVLTDLEFNDLVCMFQSKPDESSVRIVPWRQCRTTIPV